jgi:hypothetical protein
MITGTPTKTKDILHNEVQKIDLIGWCHCPNLESPISQGILGSHKLVMDLPIVGLGSSNCKGSIAAGNEPNGR